MPSSASTTSAFCAFSITDYYANVDTATDIHLALSDHFAVLAISTKYFFRFLAVRTSKCGLPAG